MPGQRWHVSASPTLCYSRSFKIPHFETHAIDLPHALVYNAVNVLAAMKMLADASPEKQRGRDIGIEYVIG
jgi:alcohol dehydrogenase class IV